MADAHGWVPGWRTPLLALVALISVAMGGLLLGLLINVTQQRQLLSDLSVRWPPSY